MEYLPWLSLTKSIPLPLSFSHCLKVRSDMPFLTAASTPCAVVKCSGKSAKTAHCMSGIACSVIIFLTLVAVALKYSVSLIAFDTVSADIVSSPSPQAQ